jgi:signal transduction histidine kinase
LDFTRIESMDRQAVSVSDMIRQTLERFPAPASVEVTLDLPDDLSAAGAPRIYADPKHVVQVLGNIVINAYQSMASTSSIKDMPQGGKLTISSYMEATNEMLCIVIQDTGVNIFPENAKIFFESLITTNAKGIGLGLVVSEKLIEANGGRLQVQSESGVGNVFSVYLPIYKELTDLLK